MIIYLYILMVAMFFHELGHYIKARQYNKNIRIILDLREKTRVLGTELPLHLNKQQTDKIIYAGIGIGYFALIIGVFSVEFNIYAFILITLIYFLMCNKDVKDLCKK